MHQPQVLMLKIIQQQEMKRQQYQEVIVKILFIIVLNWQNVVTAKQINIQWRIIVPKLVICANFSYKLYKS